jgi:hypothetical protein
VIASSSNCRWRIQALRSLRGDDRVVSMTSREITEMAAATDGSGIEGPASDLSPSASWSRGRAAMLVRTRGARSYDAANPRLGALAVKLAHPGRRSALRLTAITLGIGESLELSRN